MPDIKGVLQDEIKRLAKREIKAATAPLLKNIMELKRKVTALERALALSEKETAKVKTAAEVPVEKAEGSQAKPRAEKEKKSRFNGKKIIRLRKRLHLSQAELAELVGVNMFSVSHWELGKNLPRQALQDKLEELCQLPRKALQERLAPIRAGIREKKALNKKSKEEVK